MWRHIEFDKVGYLSKIKLLNQMVMTETLAKLATDYRNNLASNEFNQLDVKYIGAMLSSVTYRMARPMDGKLQGTVGVGDKSVANEYYRVVYYEYGTGEMMQAPLGYNPGSDPHRNPARGSEHHFYTWQNDHTTLGGNKRKGSGKPPLRIYAKKRNGKPNYYGMPIQPHFNMRRAVMDAKPFLRSSLQRVVTQMNPISYISLRGIKVRA